jgi:hypothetical protein
MLSTLVAIAPKPPSSALSPVGKDCRVAFRHRQETRRYALAPHKDTTMAEV